MEAKFLVIDGSSLIHRAFFALPPLTTVQGIPTGAVYGLCNMLLRLLKEVKPHYLAVAFDKSRKTFRSRLYPDYKGQRKPTPPELKEQFPLAIQVLQALNITTLELDDYEADDIIGTLARKAGADAEVKIIVVTGDRDELQLLDERTSVYYTKKGISELKIYTPAVFGEEYGGLVPKQLIDLKGLMGDASDNIPGVAGVGPKTALKLITAYGSVENVLAHKTEVKGKSLQSKLAEHEQEALLSKKLATICLEAPVEVGLADYSLPGVSREAASLMEKLEFKNLYARFAAALGQAAGVSFTASEAGAVKTESGKTEAAKAGKAEAGPAAGLAFSQAAENKKAEPGGVGLFSLFGEETVPVIARKVLTERDAAEKFFAGLDQAGREVWFTAEVTGSIPHLTFSRAAVGEGQGLYLLETPEVLQVFAGWLESSPCPKGTINSKEIYRAACCQKIKIRNLKDDLAVAAYLDTPGLGSYELKNLVFRYLTGEQEPEASVLPQLGQVLLDKLQAKELLSLYRELEMPLIPVLAQMEVTGIRIDAPLLQSKDRQFAAQIKELISLAKEQAGEDDFNPQSPKQLGTILFEKFKLPAAKKTKTGYSTDVSVLEQLAGQHPLVETILKYRTLSKLYSTYLEGLQPLINPETQRVHTHFQQLVTVTGRLSSTDPNLQNIPARTDLGRGIREVFVPGNGYDWLLSCDYSQIELRILAHFSQDPLLLESFRKGEDIHARTAAAVFGLPLEQVSPELRRRAKAVNFGIVYGISDFGLAKQIGCPRKEAAAFISQYFARYPGVKNFMDRAIAQARSQGYVTTLRGRRRYLPEINSSNFNRRSFAERTAVNTPIQGTAADIMKMAMLAVDEKLRRAEVKSRVLLQVHDELILEVTDGEKEAVGNLVQQAMEKVCTLSVPLLAEVSTGRNWAETE